MVTEATSLERRPNVTALAEQGNGFSVEETELIRKTIAKGATDTELKLFLMDAHRRGLDPFARQIFLVPRGYGDNKQMVTQTSIDGYRLIAERTGKYVPGDASYEYDEQGRLLPATVTVKKLVAGTWHEIRATAFYDEYVQTTGQGQQQRPNQMWGRMPRLMLAKCAESLALRKAFPAELSGLYTQDEMGTHDEPAPPPRSATQQHLKRIDPSQYPPQHAGGPADYVDASDYQTVNPAGAVSDDDALEADAIRAEAAGDGTVPGVVEANEHDALDTSIETEYGRLVKIVDDCRGFAIGEEKRKYKRLPFLADYIRAFAKDLPADDDPLNVLPVERKQKLLKYIQGQIAMHDAIMHNLADRLAAQQSS
jgi:phage recombination protein Bet